MVSQFSLILCYVLYRYDVDLSVLTSSYIILWCAARSWYECNPTLAKPTIGWKRLLMEDRSSWDNRNSQNTHEYLLRAGTAEVGWQFHPSSSEFWIFGVAACVTKLCSEITDSLMLPNNSNSESQCKDFVKWQQ